MLLFEVPNKLVAVVVSPIAFFVSLESIGTFDELLISFDLLDELILVHYRSRSEKLLQLCFSLDFFVSFQLSLDKVAKLLLVLIFEIDFLSFHLLLLFPKTFLDEHGVNAV